jgi:transposase
VEDGERLWVYMTYQCSSCPLQSKCTTGNAKRLKRWEKEHVLDAADALLKKNPDVMRQRKRLVEHPFGTIKHWMGSTHFMMKRLPNVQAEMSLHVLTYNLRRAINILGVPKIIEQLQTA